MSVVLRLAGVARRYTASGPAVIEGLDFELQRGEYVAIMGESGVGKSTLLNLMAGLDRADAGRRASRCRTSCSLRSSSSARACTRAS